MARGWESKGIEEQQAEAQSSTSSGKRPITSEEAATGRKREGLRLQRERIAKQIEATQNERYRGVLQAALQDLDAQLAALS
ncbi:MAG TPA: hypothetical protein VGF44_14110 [Terriglobales bacterium]|jgi:hypothetical protein